MLSKTRILASIMAVWMLSLVHAYALTTRGDFDGVSPATAAAATTTEEKTVFLYNVNKKVFLEAGGCWGTEAVQGTWTNGVPFIVETVTKDGNTYYRLKCEVKTEGDSTTSSYLTFMGSQIGLVSMRDRYNYFLDWKASDYNLFEFTPASNYIGFYISCDNGFFMCADYHSNSTSNVDNKDIAITGFYKGTTMSNNIWKLVTLKERNAYVAKSRHLGYPSAGVTYLLKDYTFNRKNSDISNWKINGSTTSIVNGQYPSQTWEHFPTDADGGQSSGFLYKYTYTGTCDGLDNKHSITYTTDWTYTKPTRQYKYYAIYCTHSDCSKGANNKSYSAPALLTLDERKTVAQSTTTTKTGNSYYYYVGNGYADDANQRYYGNKWTANIHAGYLTSMAMTQTFTAPVEGYYRVKLRAFSTTKWDKSSARPGKMQIDVRDADADEPETSDFTYFKSSDLNRNTATYCDGWDELQNDKYLVSIVVKAKKDQNIIVQVSGGGGYDDWTCFDDFEIEYIGGTEWNFILDETRTSVDYLNDENSYEDGDGWKSTVYLHRSFTPYVWNTIILPFAVDKQTIQEVFGTGTELRRFVGATNSARPHTLYFDKATSINAGTLYLIKPQIYEPSGQAEVTATAYNGPWKLSDKYWTLPGINAVDEEEYDASGLVYTSDKGKETYEGSTNLQAVGTYIQKVHCVPAGSYMFKAGDANVEGSTGEWYYSTSLCSSRGFRGWLQPVDATKSVSLQSIVIGDEEYPVDATPVEGLFADDLNLVSGNIYNLSGQLVRENATTTNGLPKGIYIVGGRKVSVK